MSHARTSEDERAPATQVAKGLPADKQKDLGVVPVEEFKLLNVKKGTVDWDLFPADFAKLTAAMDGIPDLAGKQDQTFRVLMAILCARNAQSAGNSAATGLRRPGQAPLQVCTV